MPGIPTLVIERDDDTTRATLDGITARKTESLIEQWTAEIVVDRSDWLDVRADIDRVNDRFRIERSDGSTFFEGRLADAPRDGDNITVVINSYEQDAIDAEPTGGRRIYNSVADSAVVQDAIDSVGTLTAGTVETGASSVSFTFSNAEQAKVIRDAAEPGGMDVAYYADRTVDFVQRLGSDKSGTITVSTTAQDIVDQLDVVDNYRDPVTHIRGLGAQSGPDQVSATAVASSYSTGEKQVWRRYPNKDVVNADRMQAIVDRMITEYENNPRRVTVEAGLVDVDVDLGDTIQVTLPEHDIDEPLRIMRLQEIIGTASRYIAKLTNRRPERGGGRKARDDLQRFNAGDQGFIDRDTDAYGWQPVNASVNATRPYPYPDDVLSEVKAEVIIDSRPYRAFSSGAASGGGSVETTTATSAVNQTNSIATGYNNATDVSTSETIPLFAQNQGLFASVDVNTTNGVEVSRLLIEDTTAGETLYDVNVQDTHTTYVLKIPVDSEHNTRTGNTIQATAYFPTGADGDLDLALVAEDEHTHNVTLPDHTHPPDPGLIEFATETASNVDLIVNGTTVATDINSGTFSETVDIAGHLTPGSNTIELSSDSLGLVNLNVNTQLFRSGREVL